MKTFLHSGGLGDIIYSLPVVKYLLNDEKAIMYIKNYNHYNNTVDNFEAIYSLLKYQNFILDVLPYNPNYPVLEEDPNVIVDYNLDKFRCSLPLFQNHLISCSFAGQGIYNYTLEVPWIEIPNSENKLGKYCIINRTSRYHTNFNWTKKIYELNELYNNNVYFVGLEYEYNNFLSFGNINYLKCNDLLDIACYLKNADSIYLNQSVCLTLCQALGLNYELELEPNHNFTVRLFMENEKILC